jgi:hypothetical protein
MNKAPDPQRGLFVLYYLSSAPPFGGRGALAQKYAHKTKETTKGFEVSNKLVLNKSI